MEKAGSLYAPLYADMAYVENKIDDDAFLGYIFYSAGLAMKNEV